MFRSNFLATKKATKPPILELESTRGRSKISIGGFLFNLVSEEQGGRVDEGKGSLIDEENGPYKVYRCEEKYNKMDPCQATVHVFLDISYVMVRKHNHPVKEGKLPSLQLKRTLKLHGEMNPAVLPKTAVANALKDIDESTRNWLPKVASLKRTVQKGRNARWIKIPNAKLPDNINIKAIMKLRFKDGSRFLINDNKKPGRDRWLIFSSKKNLKILKKCKLLACDATYKKSPRPFEKLWTIHGMIRGRWIPLVFVLMNSANKELLESVLRSLPSIKHLQAVLGDFDKAQRKAWLRVYLYIKYLGCFFHYCQAIGRKMTELLWKPNKRGKFRNKLYSSVSFQQLLDRFYYLGFCKPQDVELAFLAALYELELDGRATESEIESFRDYMQKNWIGKTENGIYKPGVFNMDMWNCLRNTLVYGVRANNSIEGWNSTLFLSMNVKGHPQIGRFLNVLFTELPYNEQIYYEIKKAPVALPLKERNLRQLMMEYNFDDYDPTLYLESIRQVYRPDRYYKEPMEDPELEYELSPYELTSTEDKDEASGSEYNVNT